MATLRQVFHDIAEAIRSKGITGTFKPIDMASKIGEIRSLDGYGYLTLTAEEATTIKFKLNASITVPHKLLKSTDLVNWTEWENPDTNAISLNAGESVYLKSYEETTPGTRGKSQLQFNSFSFSGKIKCYGDIRSIVRMIVPFDYRYWFNKLFLDCTTLTKAPELPSPVVSEFCYNSMFDGCTSLKIAPELPATTLGASCYAYMFRRCTSLTTAPELPATQLAGNCYQQMFKDCTSLIKAPSVLPATSSSSGYQYMFQNCSSLKTAPEIKATTVGSSSCQYMFDGCTSLTKAPSVLPAMSLAQTCYQRMFQNCKSLEIGPYLPATTMVDSCYSYMFYGCSSLKRIKMNASSSQWGTYMFYGCTSLELIDMTGSTGVPHLAYSANFQSINSTYKIVVPDSLYDTWIAATNWASIATHIMKKSDWNAAHPDDQL